MSAAQPAPDASAQAERDDQVRLLQDSVTAFAAGRLPLARARKLRKAQPEFDPAMFEELAGQGWTGLLLPEEFGGFGLGFAEARVVIEGLAAQLAPEPLVPVAVLAAGALRRCAKSAQRDELLGALAAGTAVPGLVWQNVAGSLELEQPPFSAVPAGEGWTLEGEARFVRPGSGATVYLLLASTPQGVALFVVEPGSSGLEVKHEAQADGTSLARLKATKLRVNAAAALTLARADLAAALDEALVMNAVELLALITRMRAMTLDYLKTRVQFGKAIGSFQSLQHRSADMLIQEELTRAVVGQAVAALDADLPQHKRSSMASRAKARAAEAAMSIAREAIQLHGGIAVTDEYDLSLYVNRVLSLVPWLGNAQAHRRRYVRLNPPVAGSEG